MWRYLICMCKAHEHISNCLIAVLLRNCELMSDECSIIKMMGQHVSVPTFERMVMIISDYCQAVLNEDFIFLLSKCILVQLQKVQLIWDCRFQKNDNDLNFYSNSFFWVVYAKHNWKLSTSWKTDLQAIWLNMKFLLVRQLLCSWADSPHLSRTDTRTFRFSQLHKVCIVIFSCPSRQMM